MGSPRWRNYARTQVTTPDRWHRPTSEVQVVAAVRSARHLKVLGSGHSFSAIALPEHEAMTLDGLTGVLALDDDTVRVRAGTRLRDLSGFLARRGLTLPIVGSIQAQTVAGAIATGTHGSSLVHGNLSSLVRAIRLVDGTGRVHALDAEDPRLPGARVHLGALGVVTEVTLQVTPAFRLRQVVEQVPVDEVAGQLEQVAGSAEYVKVWWLPHARTAQVVRYSRTDEPLTRRPSSRTQRWVDENVLHRVAFPALVALGHRRPGVVPRVNRALASRYLGKPVQVAPSTALLTTPMPLRHRETEVAVPVGVAADAVDLAVELVRREGIAADFPLEARFVRGDDAWLSPAQGGDVCQLGAYTTDGPDCERYFAGFWEAMRGLPGARPHWGKELDHTHAELARVYPELTRFQELRDQLDPGRVFSNPFLRQVLGS